MRQPAASLLMDITFEHFWVMLVMYSSLSSPYPSVTNVRGEVKKKVECCVLKEALNDLTHT